MCSLPVSTTRPGVWGLKDDEEFGMWVLWGVVIIESLAVEVVVVPYELVAAAGAMATSSSSSSSSSDAGCVRAVGWAKDVMVAVVPVPGCVRSRICV